MSDDRIIIAIGRIERAISRIESVQPSSEGALRAIEEKHAQLRSETSAALADLNQLIGRIQEGNHG
ncbi:MAG: hypothetical protein JJE34_04710 [Alphaproteobacteria bacterium]|nr:hypothetical protein [Alphaproteobacteria bacterium]